MPWFPDRLHLRYGKPTQQSPTSQPRTFSHSFLRGTRCLERGSIKPCTMMRRTGCYGLRAAKYMRGSTPRASHWLMSDEYVLVRGPLALRQALPLHNPSCLPRQHPTWQVGKLVPQQLPPPDNLPGSSCSCSCSCSFSSYTPHFCSSLSNLRKHPYFFQDRDTLDPGTMAVGTVLITG